MKGLWFGEEVFEGEEPGGKDCLLCYFGSGSRVEWKCRVLALCTPMRGIEEGEARYGWRSNGERVSCSW